MCFFFFFSFIEIVCRHYRSEYQRLPTSMDLPVHFAKSCQSLPVMLMWRLTLHQSRAAEPVALACNCPLSAVAAVPDADACVIDSLHLTSAMSEQRSIQQISARKNTRSSVSVLALGLRCLCMPVCVCVFLQVTQFVTKPMSIAHRCDLQGHFIGQKRGGGGRERERERE